MAHHTTQSYTSSQSHPFITEVTPDDESPPLQVEQAARARVTVGSASTWSTTVNMLATTIGAVILSVPMTMHYCGLAISCLLLGVFALASAISLHYLVHAAELTGASSYVELGSKCFGNRGRVGVLASLLLLLTAAAVTVHIILVDLALLLLRHARPHLSLHRGHIGAVVTVILVPICLPRQLNQLRYFSTASVVAIIATALSVICIPLFGGSK